MIYKNIYKPPMPIGGLLIERKDNVILTDMFKNSKKSEFHDFYNSHIDKVYRYVFFRVSADKELAQDLVSEIFLKALTHFGDYNKDISKSAWVMTIAKNHLANYWRDKKPAEQIPEDEDEYVGSFWLKSAVNTFKREKDKQQLAELLEKLGPDDKEIVTFHYLFGYSYAEIAAMKNMTETAVKVAAHRAIKRLGRDSSLRSE